MTKIPADFPVIREFRDGPRERFVCDCIHRHSVWKSSCFSGSANLREMPAFSAGSEPGKGLEHERHSLRERLYCRFCPVPVARFLSVI